VLTGLIALATCALLAVFAAPRAGDIVHDVTHIQPWVFAVTLVLGLTSLILRGEAWRTCLYACNSKHSPRKRLHAANSFGMLGGSVNPYVGPAMRIGLLRRLDGENSPRPGQMLAAEMPILLVEVGIAVLLFTAVVGAAGLPWWLPVVIGAVVLLLAGGLWLLRQRLVDHATAQGLNVLISPRHRKQMLIILAVAIILQVARTWIFLDAVHLHPAFWQVVMTFCATGVLGILPLGPTASSGATFAVFGTVSTTTAAAGVIMATMAFATALVYAAWGVSVVAHHLLSHRLAARRLQVQRL